MSTHKYHTCIYILIRAQVFMYACLRHTRAYTCTHVPTHTEVHINSCSKAYVYTHKGTQYTHIHTQAHRHSQAAGTQHTGTDTAHTHTHTHARTHARTHTHSSIHTCTYALVHIIAHKLYAPARGLADTNWRPNQCSEELESTQADQQAWHGGLAQ